MVTSEREAAREVHPAPRSLDPVHADVHGVPEAQGGPAPPPDQSRLSLVQIEVVAAQSPHRQEALVDVRVLAGESHEGARADHARDLACKGALPAALEELALEQKGRARAVRRALDRHRLALALGAVPAGFGHRAALGRALGGADRGEQGPVRNEVRVAANRRGEVAVSGAAEARVAQVPRRVVRLLERAQEEGGPRPAAVPAALGLTGNQPACLGDDARRIRP